MIKRVTPIVLTQVIRKLYRLGGLYLRSPLFGNELLRMVNILHNREAFYVQNIAQLSVTYCWTSVTSLPSSLSIYKLFSLIAATRSVTYYTIVDTAFSCRIGIAIKYRYAAHRNIK